MEVKFKGKFTRGISQNGRQSRFIDRGNQRGVSLSGIVLERVVDIGLRHGEEDPIDDMDNAIGCLDVGFDDTGTVHGDHLSDYTKKKKEKKEEKKKIRKKCHVI